MCILWLLKQRRKDHFTKRFAFAIYDGFPVNKGHMLIMPKRHEESFFSLTSEEKKAIDQLVLKAKE